MNKRDPIIVGIIIHMPPVLQQGAHVGDRQTPWASP